MDKIGVRIGLNMVFAVPRLPSVMALGGGWGDKKNASEWG